MVVSLREFRYLDRDRRESVVVPRGTEMTESVVARLTANRVDVDKLIRTQYLGDGLPREATVVSPVKRKRGRPKKSA